MIKKSTRGYVVNTFMNAMYALNIIIQSFFNLLTPIGLSLLASWLLVEKAGMDGWIYAVLIILGVIIGFYSMIRFLLSAMAGLERLENEQEQKKKRK